MQLFLVPSERLMTCCYRWLIMQSWWAGPVTLQHWDRKTRMACTRHWSNLRSFSWHSCRYPFHFTALISIHGLIHKKEKIHHPRDWIRNSFGLMIMVHYAIAERCLHGVPESDNDEQPGHRAFQRGFITRLALINGTCTMQEAKGLVDFCRPWHC